VDGAEGNHTEHAENNAAAIREQLDRLLGSSYFNHSKRIPSFLKFVVEQTVSGQTEPLKERTLGVEIFGRDADYDTGSDSIVRVTAAELRKRIAQYYQEPGHEGELRISLPSGSYIPFFRWPNAAPENEEKLSATVAAAPAELAAIRGRQRLLRPAVLIPATLVVLILLTAGVFFYWKTIPRRALPDSFWSPAFNTSDPVLLCVADQSQYPVITLRDSTNLSHQITLKSNLTTVVIDDLGPIIKISSMLQAHGKKYSLKGESETSLLDLRNGPTILIGAFDNIWTMRLMQSLRYRFANNPEMTEFGIVDSAHPAPMKWKINRQQQISTNNYGDYAIIARFTDATTGKLTIVAAGVGLGGTIAAAEFIANLDDLAQAMRGAGNRKNMEIVLSTQIIDGEPGTPKLEATYFW
jgi:hypothetical protein